MKKIIPLLLVSILILTTLPACSFSWDQLPFFRPRELCVVLPDLQEDDPLYPSLQHAEEELDAVAVENEYEVQFLLSADNEEQQQQLYSLIEQKVSGIVLWPHDPEAVREAAAAVMAAKIPLIVYGEAIPDLTATATFIYDPAEIGTLIGQAMNDAFSDELAEGEVRILEFRGDDLTRSIQYHQGFEETASDGFRVLQSFRSDWSRERARAQMEELLSIATPEEISQIGAVVTYDDQVALGVLDAIDSYSGEGSFDLKLVTGAGADAEFLSRMEAGDIPLITYGQSLSAIREAVRAGESAVKKLELTYRNVIPVVTIDPDSLGQYLDEELLGRELPAYTGPDLSEGQEGPAEGDPTGEEGASSEAQDGAEGDPASSDAEADAGTGQAESEPAA